MNLPPCVPGTYRFGQINSQDLSLSTAPRSPKRENDDLPFPSQSEVRGERGASSTTLSEGSTEFIANSKDSTAFLRKPSAEGFNSSSDEDPFASITTNLYEDTVELSKGQKRKNAQAVNPRPTNKGKFTRFSKTYAKQRPFYLLYFTLFY